MRDLLLGPVDLPRVRALFRRGRHVGHRLIGCSRTDASLGLSLDHVFLVVHGHAQVVTGYAN